LRRTGKEGVGMKPRARLDRRTTSEIQRFLKAEQAERKESMRSVVTRRCTETTAADEDLEDEDAGLREQVDSGKEEVRDE
jgi:hypothetical protein